jgi:hypothetical protein
VIVVASPSIRSIYELCGGLINKPGKNVREHASEEVRCPISRRALHYTLAGSSAATRTVSSAVAHLHAHSA